MNKHIYTSILITAAAAIIIGAGYVFAQPTSPPPSSNVGEPLYAQGDQQLDGNLTIADGNQLLTPELCLAGNCQTAWPSGSTSSGGVGTPDVTTYTFDVADYCDSSSSLSTVEYWSLSTGQPVKATTNAYTCSKTFALNTASMPNSGVPLNVYGNYVYDDVRCYNVPSTINPKTGLVLSGTLNPSTSPWTEPEFVNINYGTNSVQITVRCMFYHSSARTQADGHGYFASKIQYIY